MKNGNNFKYYGSYGEIDNLDQNVFSDEPPKLLEEHNNQASKDVWNADKF